MRAAREDGRPRAQHLDLMDQILLLGFEVGHGLLEVALALHELLALEIALGLLLHDLVHHFLLLGRVLLQRLLRRLRAHLVHF